MLAPLTKLNSTAALLALAGAALVGGCQSSGKLYGSAPNSIPWEPYPPAASVATGSSPAALSGSSTIPVGPKITAGELQSMIPSNTATGISRSGGTYYAWFDPTGQVRFVEGDVHDTGSWRILPDGQLCSQMSRIGGGTEQCYTIYRSGTGYAYQRSDGATLGTFSTIPGNPENL